MEQGGVGSKDNHIAVPQIPAGSQAKIAKYYSLAKYVGMYHCLQNIYGCTTLFGTRVF